MGSGFYRARHGRPAGSMPGMANRAAPIYPAMAWASFWMDNGAQPSASLLTVT